MPAGRAGEVYGPDTDSLDLPGDSPLVFGGGLTGLSAGYALSRSGMSPTVFEAAHVVGGLSRTMISGDFRYDIGGHRFFTKNEEIASFVSGLMGDELVRVERTSKILLRDRFFDYPLRPSNAVFGLGPLMVLRIIADYALERFKRLLGFGRSDMVSLEDWVVSNFGRTMFELYFKEYSEKVWGMDCKRISSSWVAKRIHGLSLGRAVKSAIFRFSGRNIPTLAQSFDYPALGIGRLPERFEEEISKGGRVIKDARLSWLAHDGNRITGAGLAVEGREVSVKGSHYISTVPLTALVDCMSPSPPEHVLKAASGLGYRDLVLVAVAVDRENVTGESWVYIPEKKYPFGRLHEPRNWSPAMAPKGKTLVVAEYFCFEGDHIWNTDDEALGKITVDGLEELGFIKCSEALWSVVLRVPGAYPLFDVGYEERVKVIMDYLDRFENLSIAGRAGAFAYLNMDHAIEAGFRVAKEIRKKALAR